MQIKQGNFGIPKGSIHYLKIVGGGSGSVGTSGTHVRTFLKQLPAIGSITWVSDPVAGDYVSVPEDGLYWVCYQDESSSSLALAITVDATATQQAATPSAGFVADSQLVAFQVLAAASAGSCSNVVYLRSGQKIRAQTSNAGTPATDTTEVMFTVAKL